MRCQTREARSVRAGYVVHVATICEKLLACDYKLCNFGNDCDDISKGRQIVRFAQTGLEQIDPSHTPPSFTPTTQTSQGMFCFVKNDASRTRYEIQFHSSYFRCLDENHRNMTLGQIYNRLLETYCGPIGYQYMHLHSREETSWIQVLFMSVSRFSCPPSQFSGRVP